MPRTTLAGHPLHPILVTVPIGLLPFSAVLDVMYVATGRRSYADAAYYSLVGGYAGAACAAAAGIADYFTIPSRTPVKRTANIHAVLNVGLMALQTVNLLRRRDRRVRSGRAEAAMSVAATVGLLASSWYGGTLVYEHGMRVQGVDPSAGTKELKAPGDDALDRAFRKAERPVPDLGPEERRAIG